MSTEVKTAAAALAVTIADAKRHLRITDDEHDLDLLKKLRAAIATAEEDLNVSLITRTLIQNRNAFPAGREIELASGPVQSIVAVSYYDTAGVLQTLAASEYELDGKSSPPVLTLAEGCTWPSTASRRNAIEIEYVAGYGASSASVPEGLQLAVLMALGSAWEFREDTVGAVGAADTRRVESALGYDDLVQRHAVVMSDDEFEDP